MPTDISKPIITRLWTVLEIELEKNSECLWVSDRIFDSWVLLHGLHPVLEFWSMSQNTMEKRKSLNNISRRSGGHRGRKTALKLLFYYWFCFLSQCNIQLRASDKYVTDHRRQIDIWKARVISELVHSAKLTKKKSNYCARYQ